MPFNDKYHNKGQHICWHMTKFSMTQISFFLQQNCEWPCSLDLVWVKVICKYANRMQIADFIFNDNSNIYSICLPSTRYLQSTLIDSISFFHILSWFWMPNTINMTAKYSIQSSLKPTMFTVDKRHHCHNNKLKKTSSTEYLEWKLSYDIDSNNCRTVCSKPQHHLVYTARVRPVSMIQLNCDHRTELKTPTSWNHP